MGLLVVELVAVSRGQAALESRYGLLWFHCSATDSFALAFAFCVHPVESLAIESGGKVLVVYTSSTCHCPFLYLIVVLRVRD